jgi:hypothetical protein
VDCGVVVVVVVVVVLKEEREEQSAVDKHNQVRGEGETRDETFCDTTRVPFSLRER